MQWEHHVGGRSVWQGQIMIMEMSRRRPSSSRQMLYEWYCTRLSVHLIRMSLYTGRDVRSCQCPLYVSGSPFP